MKLILLLIIGILASSVLFLGVGEKMANGELISYFTGLGVGIAATIIALL